MVVGMRSWQRLTSINGLVLACLPSVLATGGPPEKGASSCRLINQYSPNTIILAPHIARAAVLAAYSLSPVPTSQPKEGQLAALLLQPRHPGNR
jgi:hypothetical protein